MIRLFDWDARNEDHIARHDVEPYEAEEAMSDVSRVSFDAHGKGVKGVIGKTDDERMLVVIYIVRNDLYRVITARDANDGEKHVYRRRNR